MSQQQPGSLENIILKAIWTLEEDDNNVIRVMDVKALVNETNEDDQTWAYTTIKTVMDRLVVKKLLKKTLKGKKYFYNSTISRNEYGRNFIKRTIKDYYNNDFAAFQKMLKEIEQDYLSLV